VEENFARYGVNHRLTLALLIGGVSFDEQDRKITRGADVLIATPGRLLDHFERGRLLLSGVEILVIDEADRMLDMGFIPDIERIVKLIPFTRQTLLFSATMPAEIARLADQFLQNPVRVEAARPATTGENVTQRLVASEPKPQEKRITLRRVLGREGDELKNAIIFCNRKRDVATLYRSLERHGHSAGALHGDMDQYARMRTLDAFRDGEIKLLVASDVAARGLDIPDVSHIINFDVPTHPEDYVHRIGRTARAGKSGAAVTIAGPIDEVLVPQELGPFVWIAAAYLLLAVLACGRDLPVDPGEPDPDFLRPLLHSRYKEEPGWQNPYGFVDISVDELIDEQTTQTGSSRKETVAALLR
jgi:superfamily II DNA/RNA helicase